MRNLTLYKVIKHLILFNEKKNLKGLYYWAKRLLKMLKKCHFLEISPLVIHRNVTGF